MLHVQERRPMRRVFIRRTRQAVRYWEADVVDGQMTDDEKLLRFVYWLKGYLLSLGNRRMRNEALLKIKAELEKVCE
jgi:hypothetical protein